MARRNAPQRSIFAHGFRALLGSALACGVGVAAFAQGDVVGWGASQFDSAWNDETFVDVVAGRSRTLAIRTNGELAFWGVCTGGGSCYIPPLPPGVTFVQVDTGADHHLACLSDGSILAWGNTADGKCNIPPPRLRVSRTCKLRQASVTASRS